MKEEDAFDKTNREIQALHVRRGNGLSICLKCEAKTLHLSLFDLQHILASFLIEATFFLYILKDLILFRRLYSFLTVVL